MLNHWVITKDTKNENIDKTNDLLKRSITLSHTVLLHLYFCWNLHIIISGGPLSIENLTGQLDAKTSGGSIDVGNVMGNVKLHTSGGSIKTRIDKQLTKNAKLTTSAGSITAYLMPNIRVDIDASTSGGSVKSEFKIDGKNKKMSVRGSINGGGPKLILKTSGGSNKIKEIE